MFSLDNVIDDLWPQAKPAPWQKKVLKKLDIEAEVEHSDLSSATPGAADLFVMAKDIAASASVPESQLVVITNIIDINELEAQLRAWFERQ